MAELQGRRPRRARQPSYTPAELLPFLNDADWAIYCYGTVHRFFGDVTKAFTQYDSADGSAPPAPVVVPTVPGPPLNNVPGSIEARRALSPGD